MIFLRRILKIPAKTWNWLQFKLLKTSFIEYPTINGRLVIGGRGKLIIGRKVAINSSHRSNPVGGADRTSIHIAPNAIVSIGDNVGISNSLFYAIKSITIEEDVMIGGGCQLYDNDFHSINYQDRVLGGDKKVKSAPVLIRKGAFIGTSTIILKGVEVGERSVVAAGSVLTKSVPADEIWGGNPAKFIKKISTGNDA